MLTTIQTISSSRIYITTYIVVNIYLNNENVAWVRFLVSLQPVVVESDLCLHDYISVVGVWIGL